ncbi:hypothetical protein [Rhodoferax sp. PAMC 29310]|uniref:hypothetical protein n=1 Tax=Rhodoferax sp. PAMC 29310 TaxID=2822760 RepID=UPI001B33920C|nr:hypothetical protein [Rhodoferax sp. PAMC 29310]
MSHRLLAIAFTVLIEVLFTPSVVAASSTAGINAIVIAPVQVSADTSTQLLVSSTTGVLILSIPGGGGSAASTMTLTASGAVASGSPTTFTASDIAGLAALITQMTTSGGTLTTSGTLSGTGVQIVVIQAATGSSDGGTVTATVTYN